MPESFAHGILVELDQCVGGRELDGSNFGGIHSGLRLPTPVEFSPLPHSSLSTNPEPSPSRAKIVHDDSKLPDLVGSIVRGSVGFGTVGLAAFSVWAFGGQWFQAHFGEAGLYGACAFVFIALSGFLLHPLLGRSGSLLRFYTIFVPAFLAYAIVWCLAWFPLRFGTGEWLGSLLGTAAFMGVVSWRLHNVRGLLQTILIVFGLHSAGYFLGGKAMQWLLGAGGSALLSGLSKPGRLIAAELAWGLLYGLGFGAGIGYGFHAAQKTKVSARGS